MGEEGTAFESHVWQTQAGQSPSKYWEKPSWLCNDKEAGPEVRKVEHCKVFVPSHHPCLIYKCFIVVITSVSFAR